MPVTEFYVKLVVGFPRDPKVRALARYGIDGVLARDLYVQMILYCRENLSDGFVPAEEVGVLAYPVPADHANQLAKQLASVGLTKELSKNEAKGWEVLAYVKRNGTKADVEALSKVRAEAGRAGGAKSRKPAQSTRKATSKQVANQIGKQNPSNPVSVSVSNETENRDIQTPTVSAGETAGTPPMLTETQRSKRLTDAYAEAEPMCKWVAVNGVVLSAIKSGRFADEEIRGALLRLADQGRSVTVDSLRTELQGFPPQQQGRPQARPAPSGESTGTIRARAASDAGRRVQQAIDEGRLRP
jgi:hypothetical protein